MSWIHHRRDPSRRRGGEEKTSDPEKVRGRLQGLAAITKKIYELLRPYLSELEQNETRIALRQAEAAAQNGSPDELGAALFRLEHASEMLDQAMLRGDLPKR